MMRHHTPTSFLPAVLVKSQESMYSGSRVAPMSSLVADASKNTPP